MQITVFTNKFGLAAAVRLGAMPARAASLRSVAGVHQDQWHTRQFRFVPGKLPQFGKTPTTYPGPLPLVKPLLEIGFNAFEFFQGQSFPKCLSGGNQLFADAVVGVFSKVLFFLGNLFLKSVKTARTFAALCLLTGLVLQRLAQCAIFLARLFYFRAAKGLVLRSCGEVDHAQIHAHEISDGRGHNFGNIAHRLQVIRAIAINQIRLAFARGQQLSLVFAADKGDGLPALYRPDGNRVRSVVGVIAQDAVIVGNRPICAESPLSVLVPFVGVRNFADSPDDDLRRQVKGFFDGLVNQPVQPELSKLPRLPSGLADTVTGGIDRLQSIAQGLGLCGRRLQFQADGQLHSNCKYSTTSCICKHLITRAEQPAAERTAFPLQLTLTGIVGVSTPNLR